MFGATGVASAALVAPESTGSQSSLVATNAGVRPLGLAAVFASSSAMPGELASRGHGFGRGITGRAELASIDTSIDLVGFASPSLLPDFGHTLTERSQFMPAVLRGSQDTRELKSEIAAQPLTQATSSSTWERVFAQDALLTTALGTPSTALQIGVLREPASVTLVAAGGWLSAGARRGGLR